MSITQRIRSSEYTKDVGLVNSELFACVHGSWSFGIDMLWDSNYVGEDDGMCSALGDK
jgi:hypothetical protein